MKILFLSRWFPYPPNNGSKLRIFNLIRELAQYHKITLLSFTDQQTIESVPTELASICEEVRVVSRKPFNPNSHKARINFFNTTPRSVVDTFSPEMRCLIEQTLSNQQFDVVIASQFDMAVYYKYFNHLPALFEEVEVGVLYENFARAETFGRRFRSGLTWLKHKRYLGQVLKCFKACTVVSEQERQIVENYVGFPLTVEIIPNCVDTAAYKEVTEIPEPNTLIFTGAFTYGPNYQAMQWFLKEIYPHVRAQMPEVSLKITGDHGNRPLPSTDNVLLTGFVDDIRLLVARSWASVVPLVSGGGTRLKILEAMALCTPVVATSKGAEGLEVQAGKHILIADTPEAFAHEVIRLLKEPQLRQYLVGNAYQLVKEKYDWTVVTPRFLALVDQVAYA